MNFRRRKFVRLLDEVIAGDVSTIVVAHRDRLARFGFDLIEWLATKHGCQMVVANEESLSPRQELVEDLPAIVGVFSCRLDGLRRDEKQLKPRAQGCRRLQIRCDHDRLQRGGATLTGGGAPQLG